MKFLILLAYYNRPKMVRTALQSVRDLEYDDWDVAFIDDASDVPGGPIALEYIPAAKLAIHRIEDTVENKIKRGSMHGFALNTAIQRSDADAVICLCDDDALIPDYLINLDRFFRENPRVMYAYSHVRIFNPFVDSPNASLLKTSYFTNLTDPVMPSCRVDGSQVAWRMVCNTAGAVWYRFPQTSNLDACFLSDLSNKYGPCDYTGFDGQYKAIFPDQLGVRKSPYDVQDLP